MVEIKEPLTKVDNKGKENLGKEIDQIKVI